MGAMKKTDEITNPAMQAEQPQAASSQASSKEVPGRYSANYRVVQAERPTWEKGDTQYRDLLYGRSRNPWQEEKRAPEWKDSLIGRVGIRMFSRGVLGAATFALGAMAVEKQMPGYKATGDYGRTVATQFGEAGQIAPLQYVARFIDNTAGKAISWSVRKAGFSAEAAAQAVTFRPSMHTAGMPGVGGVGLIDKGGRSLGAEVVSITTDFATASIGDAFGRNVANMLDPNASKSWMIDTVYLDSIANAKDRLATLDQQKQLRALGDTLIEGTVTGTDSKGFAILQTKYGDLHFKGDYKTVGTKVKILTGAGLDYHNARVLEVNGERVKDHFQFDKFVTAGLKGAWTILTLNQGEDWAAALPYAYTVRASRQLHDKIAPGFKSAVSDVNTNGGSWVANAQGKLTGSYTTAGASDLQLRFTFYNVFTLMYRETYAKVGAALAEWKDGGFGLPQLSIPSNPIKATLGAVADACNYGLRSTIKAGLYMTPAVPFFWGIRTPQTKYRGLAYVVDPDERRVNGGLLYNQKLPETLVPGEPKAVYRGANASPSNMTGGGSLYLGNGTQIDGHDFNKSFDPYDKSHTFGMLDKALNPIGKWSYRASHAFSDKLGGFMGNRGFNGAEWRSFGMHMANASAAYTPYMIAKAETASIIDNNFMDRAIDKTTKSLFSLDFKGAGEGIRQIGNLIVNPPRPVSDNDNQPQPDNDNNKLQAVASAAPTAKVQAAHASAEPVFYDPYPPKQTSTSATSEPGNGRAAWAEQEAARRHAKAERTPDGVTVH